MVERLLAATSGLEEDPELFGDLDLVDEVLELRRAQGAVEVVVPTGGPRVVDDDLRIVILDPGGADPLAGLDAHAAFAPAALRSAACTISSGVSPAALASSFSASGGV